MKAKKIIALALSVAMVLGLGACGQDGASGKKSADNGSKKLVVWTWDETFNIPAVKEAMAVYKKKHPGVQIKIVQMSQSDLIQKLNTNLSSNTTSGLPNVVSIEDYSSQGILTSYEDWFQDMSSKVNKSDFVNYKIKPGTYNGKLYGIPFDSGVAGLFYRTDLIEQAGYKSSDLDNITWDKFIEIGKAVKAKTGKAMLALNPSDLQIIRIMLQSAGQWYVKDDGKTVNIQNNQALKESIMIYKQIMDSGIAECVSGWYVLKKVANSDLAADFIATTFGKDKELANTLASKIGLVSALKVASTTSNYQQGVEFYNGQKTLQDFSKWAQKVPSVNYGLYTYNIEDILTGTVQSVVKGTNIDTALKSAQTQAEAAVAK